MCMANILRGSICCAGLKSIMFLYDAILRLIYLHNISILQTHGTRKPYLPRHYFNREKIYSIGSACTYGTNSLNTEITGSSWFSRQIEIEME